jgi:hypothetical protein
LDQLIAVLLREPARERKRWLQAHGRACYRRLPRHPAPPPWTQATVVHGVVTYHYDALLQRPR